MTFGGVTYEIGEKVRIALKEGGIMLFDKGSGELIGTGSAELQ